MVVSCFNVMARSLSFLMHGRFLFYGLQGDTIMHARDKLFSTSMSVEYDALRMR